MIVRFLRDKTQEDTRDVPKSDSISLLLFGWGGAPDPFEPDRLTADGTRACGYSSDRQGIDRNFCHFEMVAVVVAEETTMRATFVTAILVTASLMGAVALTSAQNSGGDQEKV